MSNCPQYERLTSKVDALLQELVDKTTLQLEVFRSKDPERMMRVDKELELLVGEKERAIGAMREHAAEHKCHTSALSHLSEDRRRGSAPSSKST